jgi:hypothetical protein
LWVRGEGEDHLLFKLHLNVGLQVLPFIHGVDRKFKGIHKPEGLVWGPCLLVCLTKDIFAVTPFMFPVKCWGKFGGNC